MLGAQHVLGTRLCQTRLWVGAQGQQGLGTGPTGMGQSGASVP